MPYSYFAIGQEAVSEKSVVTAPRMPNRFLSLFSLMSMKFVTNHYCLGRKLCLPEQLTGQ